MKHKCFISAKTEDFEYKKEMIENEKFDFIDKSLNESIDSEDEDYIMTIIRKDYLSDSTVTIFLIGERSSENLGWEEQKYIKRELQASLYNGVGNTRSGILGIVLPSMYDKIYGGSGVCSTCGNTHNFIHLYEMYVIKEFSSNYYIPHDKCAWNEEDRYCVLVKWDDFKTSPEEFIELAFSKRSSPISEKVKIRP